MNNAEDINEKARMARDMIEFFFWKKHLPAFCRIVNEMNEDTAESPVRFGLDVALTVVEDGVARRVPIVALLPAFNGPETGEVTTGIKLYELPPEPISTSESPENS